MRESARRENDGTAQIGKRALGIVTVAVVSAMIGAASPAIAGPHVAAGTASASQASHHHHPKGHHPKRRHPKHHKPKVHLKRVSIDGLVTATHRRHVTVYATSATVGHHTTHNTTVHFLLGKGVRRNHQLRKGYVVHLVAAATSKHGLVIRNIRKQHVTASPATVVIGTVKQVSGNELTVSQFSRDDGHRGHDSQRQPLSVDISQAKVTVDGVAGTVHSGDFVAVLGEINGSSVLAARVYDLSGEAESLRGKVVAINADAVTVRSEGFNTTVSLGTGDNEVPLFIDGGAAAADQLRVNDRIVVVGVVGEEEEGFVPVLAFGFDGHNHHPCGDNPMPKHHRHH